MLRRASAEGSAERMLRAAVLEKEAEAVVVVSVSVVEWMVVGADCLRRKKGRDSEKRTMATRDLGGHSRAWWCLMCGVAGGDYCLHVFVWVRRWMSSRISGPPCCTGWILLHIDQGYGEYHWRESEGDNNNAVQYCSARAFVAAALPCQGVQSWQSKQSCTTMDRISRLDRCRTLDFSPLLPASLLVSSSSAKSSITLLP